MITHAEALHVARLHAVACVRGDIDRIDLTNALLVRYLQRPDAIERWQLGQAGAEAAERERGR